jgi:hypothetical protein
LGLCRKHIALRERPKLKPCDPAAIHVRALAVHFFLGLYYIMLKPAFAVFLCYPCELHVRDRVDSGKREDAGSGLWSVVILQRPTFTLTPHTVCVSISITNPTSTSHSLNLTTPYHHVQIKSFLRSQHRRRLIKVLKRYVSVVTLAHLPTADL